jgi:uncharacterized protein YmfQ (DUF2313 family)
MLKEADPRTCYETIDMWETDCGLPDPCIEPPPSTLEARRNAIVAKRQSGSTTHPQEFIDLAALLGYTIDIIEFRPFRAWSPCNAWLNPDGMRWAHCWIVTVHETQAPEFWFRTDSPCTAFIREFDTNSLECTFTNIQPAHTEIIFYYMLPP